MFTKVSAFLGQLKLTLQQYTLITLAAIIGVLAVVITFKNQQLRKARLNLLQAHFDTQNQAVEAAQRKSNQLLENLNNEVSSYYNEFPDSH